ncbi:MAG: hypothetical protein A2747_03895 [Candidatus Yonathbacteria bacterium RIFCSPHIGHO2_01_FULL_44_41]|uniref:Type 4 fimbrial biogenesis protein PilX N-terminal domain-containing protein n=1 Tax=Candidatus Yonathbacteria bacterium RIFCSPHIGHO2_02_FULL_44_14 TaxID=1802724 RepID=A0A1G2S7H8_9BACT|nr:MAG: hypothetical protein A2747_03895 [Candidatus Yonathbacteria bacterium RIFCSPHIGHO2_01_FULL_44_41]OHA81063.1 MAG: hypothetical protein A3D51_01785 [Candidatus Yonathbacteria bacterium RIFCSPHIGHO2_02_FULL_44_14]OHA81286.1 MAG: hypothetical protein A3B06_03495 [Candidatus Yonathbacteria bacterium RIFCSPLOWO2_01_FULL_43_20]
MPNKKGACQKSYIKCSSSGIATLPTVIMLGVMSLVVAVGITAVSLTESFVSQGNIQSNKALFYAESGTRDALIRIARNKGYTCATTDCYTVDFSTNGCSLGNDCAKMSVTGNDTAKTVTAKGIMKSSTRTLQVVVALGTDGDITSTTWSEVTN